MANGHESRRPGFERCCALRLMPSRALHNMPLDTAAPARSSTHPRSASWGGASVLISSFLATARWPSGPRIPVGIRATECSPLPLRRHLAPQRRRARLRPARRPATPAEGACDASAPRQAALVAAGGYAALEVAAARLEGTKRPKCSAAEQKRHFLTMAG